MGKAALAKRRSDGNRLPGNVRGGVHLSANIPASCVSLAVALLLASGCAGGAAFTVNGTEVPYAGFKAEIDRRLMVAERKNPKELEGKRGERLREETERQVATDLVRSVLMEQEAKKLDVVVPGEEVVRRLEEERLKRGEKAFARQLSAQGLTEARYRRTVEERILVEMLGEKVSGGVTATEDDAESFYLTNKPLFSKSAMVRVAHILLDSEGQARMVEGELKSGADFAAIAKRVSRDYVSGKNGGDLGWIEEGTMDPAFESAAFSLPTGQMSGVVRASDGYHIIKVLDRRDAYTPPFEEVREQALATVLNRKREEKFQDFLRTVYANAEVEMDPGIGKWDTRLGVVVE